MSRCSEDRSIACGQLPRSWQALVECRPCIVRGGIHETHQTRQAIRPSQGWTLTTSFHREHPTHRQRLRPASNQAFARTQPFLPPLLSVMQNDHMSLSRVGHVKFVDELLEDVVWHSVLTTLVPALNLIPTCFHIDDSHPRVVVAE